MKWVYLPKHLNLEVLLKKHPPNFKFYVENFQYIIGIIVNHKAQYKKSSEEEDGEDYVPLNAQILQSRIRNYNDYLRYLIDVGVLEKSYYIPTQKSTGYKLAPKYSEQELEFVCLTKRSFTRRTKEEVDKEYLLRRKYSHLTKWFDSKLTIDRNEATRYLASLLRKESQIDVTKARRKYVLRLLSIDKLSNNLFQYTVDDTAKRFHSNLTNLKSGLRNYLRYDGQTLTSIDVKNSQPFISTILLNPLFYLKEKGLFNLYTLSPHLYKLLEGNISNIISFLPSITSSIMLVKESESQCQTDLELYCTLVDKGRLYEFLSDRYAERTGDKLNTNVPEEKKQLKDIVFLTMFSKNKYYHQKGAEMKRFFKEIFPTVYKVFKSIKDVDNRLLPVILQSIESEIVIERITRRFAKAYPEAPIYTIHDSVVTLEKYADALYQLVKEQFESTIGLKPSLSVEQWEVREK